MMSLQNIFETILQMSLTGCFCVCVALILRPFLVRLPRIYAYILWLVIFVRLLVPVLPESRLSLIPTSLSTVTLTESSAKTELKVPAYSMGQNTEDLTQSPVSNIPAESTITKADTAPNDMFDKTFTFDKLFALIPWIWGIGFAGLLIINLIRFFLIYQLTRQAEHCEKNIYRIKDIPTSFVFGSLRPRIYISADMAESTIPYVLCHERTHIKRRDYLIKPLCFFILCLHWFNPLVWIAFYLCSQDMEISCDEHSIRNMSMEEKTGYSDALLQAATDRGSVRRPYPAFSSNEVKKRIKNVLQYKKQPVIVIGVAAVLLIIVSAGLLMNPFHDVETPQKDPTSTGDNDESDNDQPYVFPITPESEEWKNLSMQEMFDACQIPEEKLEAMTTKALLETVLNYPLINDYFAYNTYEIACNTMSSHFNGFNALFAREDVTSVLLDRYAASHVVTEDEVDFVDSSAFFETTTIEFLIICDQIKNGELSESEKERLNVIHSIKQSERNKAGIYSTNSDIILDFNPGNIE